MAINTIKDLVAYRIKFGGGFEKELRKIIALSEKSKAEILALKSIEFVKQYKNAFDDSVFYKDLYQKHGLDRNSIKEISDIHKLPVITKAEVRQNTAGILASCKLSVFKAYSSGTTGTPLQVYRDFKSTIKEYAYGHFFQQMHGYHLGDPVVSLRGTLDRNTFSYYDKSNNVLYMSSYHLSADRIDEYYKMIHDFQPKVIKGYPSSMHILATELYKSGKELHIPIGFTSSEVLHDFQKDIIQKVLHTKVFDWYGNAEQTVAFGQFDDNLYREFPLYSHIEVADDHLITTGFINSAFPLLRYKVEDVVKLSPTSNGTCVVQKIEGRDDDYILLKNGQRIGRLDLAFKKAQKVLAAQIIQKRVGEIIVNIVPDKGFSEIHIRVIEQNLRQLIGTDCQVRFEKIETSQLIRSPKGKFNLVVSQRDLV
ncbi:phenylacetate--CoA ligase family protein [Ancylomarina longa]|uniref:Phenylacetate--CoA ligase family protein n=1 Tax=Ancylomarina longa TaxID=2487017 RepID=A0A434AU43_9BACT|nr:phenylacetate--CoA ligase family protein [Ancylomarina longa]RUT77882.1 phenylacetate--CoA ligase family protein [Ancylomarina longa]